MTLNWIIKNSNKDICNNNQENWKKSQNIDKIFEDPSDFKFFWESYITSINYYIELFNPSGQHELAFMETVNLDKPENREHFFRQITDIIEKFRAKLGALGVWGGYYQNDYPLEVKKWVKWISTA